MKFVFIINHVAGKGQFQNQLIRTLNSDCADFEIPWETYETKAIGDALIYVRDYPGTEKVRFYAVGGDGTLNEVVNGAVLRGNAEVGILPCGSGNDFVKIFQNPEYFLDVSRQLEGTVHIIDLIKANDSYAINMCNMGADAQIANDLHRFTKFMHGTMAYSVAIITRLMHKLGFQSKITLDNGEEISGTFIISTFANGVAYGGGYYSAPRAKYDDGLMEICLIHSISHLKIAKLLKVYKKGLHLDDPRFDSCLTYRRSSKIIIETPVPQQLCIDGEIITVSKSVLEIVPRAIGIVLPKGVKVLENNITNPRNNR